MLHIRPQPPVPAYAAPACTADACLFDVDADTCLKGKGGDIVKDPLSAWDYMDRQEIVDLARRLIGFDTTNPVTRKRRSVGWATIRSRPA